MSTFVYDAKNSNNGSKVKNYRCDWLKIMYKPLECSKY